MGLCSVHGSVASHVHSVGRFKATNPFITCHVHRGTSEQCLWCCGSHYAAGGGPVLLGVAFSIREWTLVWEGAVSKSHPREFQEAKFPSITL